MFKIYDNKFIGYGESHLVEEFTGSDTKETLQENLRNKPIDWYYRNINITYKRNSLGHRSKEISEIDLDNYILTAGCSHTEGVGLELEKTYPYLLAEKLNCDYYNLSLGGFGVDIITHNLIVWLTTQPKKPKVIILQWSYWARFAHFHHNPSTQLDSNRWVISPEGSHTSSDSARNMLVYGEDINFFKTVEKLAKIKIDCIVKSMNIPIIHLYTHSTNLFSEDDKALFIDKIDSARDNHYGIQTHQLLATKLVNTIKEL